MSNESNKPDNNIKTNTRMISEGVHIVQTTTDAPPPPPPGSSLKQNSNNTKNQNGNS